MSETKIGSNDKIRPSDATLANAILEEFEKCGADSPGTAKGPYAMFALLKKDKPNWIFGPMRLSNRIDDLTADHELMRLPKSRKFYKLKKEENK